MHAFLVQNTCAASKPVCGQRHPAVSSVPPGQEPTSVKLTTSGIASRLSWRTSVPAAVATRPDYVSPISKTAAQYADKIIIVRATD